MLSCARPHGSTAAGENRLQLNRKSMHEPTNYRQLNFGLGRSKEALDWLEACAEHTANVNAIQVEPI